MIIVVIEPSPSVSESDRVLVAELVRRGHDVRVIVDERRTLTPVSWAVKLRAGIEALLSKAPRLDAVGSIGVAVSTARSPEELLRLASSLHPEAVLHFGKPSMAVALAESGTPVYQVWLDGQRENLRMESIIASESVSHELEVTRDDRVIERSEIVPSQSWASMDQASAATRAVVLLLRALESTAAGQPRMRLELKAGTIATLRAAVSVTARMIFRKVVRRWWRPDAWFLAYGPCHARPEQLRFLYGGRERFFADPFVVERGGQQFVFYEDYAYALRRGVISVSQLRGDGTLTEPSVVLQRPYHLSYPHVFESDGDWWMVPETAENRSVELYRASRFPSEWELFETLLHNVNAVDATLHRGADGRWWMFVNLGEHGSSTWDELSIFMALHLTGPWRPHPGNPVKRDARSARPAGQLFLDAGRLVRPAQDCSRLYGGGIRFQVVDALTETDFQEHEIRFLPPSSIPGAESLHTWSASEVLQVVDARLPMAPLDPRGFRRRFK